MKTNDHNKQLYRDMQEAPDKYSDLEIEAMMDDLDQIPDIEEAWQQFAQQHIPTERPIHTWRKIAAILFAILTLSGIAFAAIHIIKQNTGAQEMKQVEQPVIQQPVSTATVNNDTIAQTEPVIFDNVTLDSIAKEIADYHHIEVDLQNELAKQLRFYFVWKQDDDLQEVVEKLNMFDHVDMTIENGKLIVR